MIPVLKKLASFLLSLLLCLSLSANQAQAIDLPEPYGLPVQTDVLDPERPDDSGIMPLWENAPDKDDDHPITGERT